ncbi:polysaccharide deacetylase family protein [Cohnella lubricantis]|uniref:Polysaccharide deacetylase family protein n=1 Tax=Cohnella lubricantis TaxID=2163172 RepID=A0A841T9C3_9BACL|nr:polysaccharide deacetylase family protein [Cohnella lubricantis]MBB6677904.1 polysaccharide deacetylase family protein [Cohnella lubricantis]MBP2119087.1 polysaccharide deacetylase family sporulation protein PdaB [Cohnella lubricantis]
MGRTIVRAGIGAGILLLLSGFSGFGNASQPPTNSREYYESRGEIVWEVPMDEPLIALTFDDGPDERTTSRILDLLDQYHAKATFFVVGRRADLYPEIVKREALEGHEIANHTYTHMYFNRRLRQDDIEKEIDRTGSRLQELTGQECRYFRPPGGFYNDTVVRIAREHGYTVVLWSWHQDTRDWISPGVSRIVNKVLNNARNGDIVLLHDHVEGSTQTVQALAQILPELSRRGFRMVTVSELMQHKKPDSVRMNR